MGISNLLSFSNSLRVRLVTVSVITVTIPLFLVSIYMFGLLNVYTGRETSNKIRNNLSMLQLTYNNKSSAVGSAAGSLASDQSIIRMTLEKNTLQLSNYLAYMKKDKGLSMITVVDTNLRVIARGHNQDSFYDQLPGSDIFRQVKQGNSFTYASVLTKEALAAENLISVATVAGVFSGMMIQSVCPMFNETNLVGIVIVGYLLNNSAFLEDLHEQITLHSAVLQGDTIISSSLEGDKNNRHFIGSKVDSTIAKGLVEKKLDKVVGTVSFQGKQMLMGFLPIIGLEEKYIGALGTALDLKESNRLKYASMAGILLISLMSIVLAVALILLASSLITKPLDIVNKALAEMSEGGGDLTRELPVLADDEVGKLSLNFNKFLAVQRAIIRSILETASKTAALAEELSATSEQLNVTAEQTSISITGIAIESNSLSKMTENTKSEIELLLQHINYIKEANSEAIIGTQEVNSSAQDGLKSANIAGEKIESIKTRVAISRNFVDELKVKSKQINQVVEVINTIVSQTNLLSLNAAIEAARAGDAGRGFAVVAEEIRKLSDSTNKAANKIKVTVGEIIEGTDKVVSSIRSEVDEVNEGGEIIKSALNELDSIGNKVESIAQLFSNVDKIIKTQIALSGRVQNSIQEVDNFAKLSYQSSENVNSNFKQVHSATENIATALCVLAKESYDLLNLAQKFKV
ncbi:MAG TPA: hypothetical protein DF296_15120 [Candidatus Margulisbacteria bacterium]|nr:MAG: hypothetical protein A2X43_02435 [Candidatus Margulisbacteria bacterium GWD2_39_127]OGI01175.1 MAG: hypothetical protein A2X42_06050 [Candidatus Margulisbacteria bacterium GWF2_38_17]OGI09810.1 MAG: hypothetical protein A2X41_09770 [Candidatus Margulisbacteria bacterium GWE2_39_32]HAR62370.1 hypothetical protein [Candidatus Margulisiibacteriota bacterium]HCT86522.1 hypothetical protein [Candidatus Margulisiibacteriota bacterium]